MGIKEVKKNYMIDVATELFVNNSISNVTIKDISLKASVGEATIYRYFGNKQNIVLLSVMGIQKKIFNRYFNFDHGLSGFEQIKRFYYSYLAIFIEHPELYRFIGQFDLYIINEKLDSLNQYEEEINKFKNLYLESYELGLLDGSIKSQENIELFYFSTAHATMELCKKLAINGDILSQDKAIVKEKEIEELIEIILYKLKK